MQSSSEIRRHLGYIIWQRFPPFPSSCRPTRAFYFSIIAIFTVMPSGSLCGGERVYVQKYWVEPP